MTVTATDRTVQERRVIAGPVPEDFDVANDVVMGWWCFAGEEHDHPEWDALDIREPVEGPDDVVRELTAINALINELIIEWTPRWNDDHGVNRSPKFWHLLSVGWLIDLTHLVRYRYLEIQRVLDRHAGVPLVIPVVDPNHKFSFDTYSDFAQASYADKNLSTWISSLILHELMPSNVSLQRTEKLSDQAFSANAYVPPPASKAKNTLRKLKAALKPDRCRIGSGAREFTPWLKFSTLIAEIVLAAICRSSKASRSLEYCAPSYGDGRAREYFPEPFLNVLEKAIYKTMPNCLGADFQPFDQAALKDTYLPGSKRVEMSFLHLDQTRAFKIAHAIENGEILVGAQHGGNAGTSAAIQFAPETEYRYHAAITWGWTSCGGYPGNFVPLPSPQLAPWIGKHTPTEDTIVVVGTGVRFIPGRFSFEGDIFNRPASRTEKSALFDGLSSDVRKKIRYRPYFGMQSTLADASYFADRYPDIPQIKDGFFERLMRCNLMVIDHPGTTMLQALAAGIPFIGFWNPAAFHMCPEAQSKFDRLRQVGVIFDSGADAARQVNQIANDPASWWSNPDVQAAISDVRETYAKTSRTWLIDWAKALIRL